ncbi:MAG: thermonuclease family protein [Acholeplasmatales bacterium]|nr:thermonuclease family protein [Acholeplasmatales bacterium]
MKKILKSLSLVALGAGLISLASCSKGKEDSDITGSLKLTRSISDKTFSENGIEGAKLGHTTDGDTSTFILNSGKSITVRYLGIDTAESTAGYEKWGKAASVWNASILKKATSIVIESNGTEPELDSNGTRYIAYVWYKTSDTSEYRNLNLETVENGYSAYTGSASTVKYNDTFNKAAQKAKDLKLHMFGDEEDIYYPEEIKDISLKELSENHDKYYDKEKDIPTHVQFDAYIKEIKVNSKFVNATVAQIVDGKEYTYDITVGYTGNKLTNEIFASSRVKYGALIHICGFTMSSASIHGLIAYSTTKSNEFTYVKQAVYNPDLSGFKITKVEKVDNNTVLTAKDDKSVEIKITVENATKTYSVGQELTGSAEFVSSLTFKSNEEKLSTK